MIPSNYSYKKEFILLSFAEYPNLQLPFFIFFLAGYTLCLMGNILLIGIICCSSPLQTPMYFFLCNLAFLDICFTSLILPRFLLTFLNMRTISFTECMIQLYFYIGFQSAEFLLLTVMSYDRYVAICKPLHYSYIFFNRRICITLATAAWSVSILDPAIMIPMISVLPFSGSHQINHFFCDLMAILSLANTDIYTLDAVILTEGAFLGCSSFILTVYSYISIISVIVKIKTTRGRLKAFSTCSSHLTVVTMLYLTLFCIYLQPPSKNKLQNMKKASILNILLIPSLNPIIYSLRNNDVKKALGKLMSL